MYITDFYMSLVIGVVATLLFVESFGITPGGIIVASYLALVFDNNSINFISFIHNIRYSKLYITKIRYTLW